MSWNMIGAAVAGTSHIASGRPCEDALGFRLVTAGNGDEALLIVASDGAGSARHAAEASRTTVSIALGGFEELVVSVGGLTEASVYTAAGAVYEALSAAAAESGEALNEYSATFLGAVILPNKALFFQLGDGAIIRNDGTDFYTAVWHRDMDHYLNTTRFLIDDPSFPALKSMLLEEPVDELAILTDGLELLAISFDTNIVHQPFFTSLYGALRIADDGLKRETLSRRLAEYLQSDAINSRTDDDKTLFLATRI